MKIVQQPYRVAAALFRCFSLLQLACFTIYPASAGILSAIPPTGSTQSKVVDAPSIHEKLDLLADYEVVVVIDRSGSMKTQDCPTTSSPTALQSRWRWCTQQTGNLLRQTGDKLKDGVHLVLFATLLKEFHAVKLDQVAQIFRKYKPGGASNINLALSKQIESHFRYKSSVRGVQCPPKNLMLVVITDGKFTMTKALRHTITHASKRMTNDNEIVISFLQIGEEPGASDLLTDLGRLPSNEFEMVKMKPFSEVKKDGLTESLLQIVMSKTTQQTNSSMRNSPQAQVQ